MQNQYSLLYREEEREMFPTLKVSTIMETPAMQMLNTECSFRCSASARSLGRLSDVAYSRVSLVTPPSAARRTRGLAGTTCRSWANSPLGMYALMHTFDGLEEFD